MTDLRKAAEMALEAMERRNSVNYEYKVYLQDAIDVLRQALAQPANQSDCGHKEYRPFCQMCMATKQKPEQKPYADKANQLNSDRMQIDPVTGDVSIGTPSKPWVSLTDDDRIEIFNSMDGGIYGFLKTWGWLNFSKELEAKLKEKNK